MQPGDHVLANGEHPDVTLTRNLDPFPSLTPPNTAHDLERKEMSMRISRCPLTPTLHPNVLLGFSFTAVPSAIHHAGAIPVYVECTDAYVMDMEASWLGVGVGRGGGGGGQV